MHEFVFEISFCNDRKLVLGVLVSFSTAILTAKTFSLLIDPLRVKLGLYMKYNALMLPFVDH